MGTMRAWVYREDAESTPQIVLKKVPLPEIGEHDVLLKTERVSVCATDEMLFAGLLNRATSGVIPGHEVCGRVIRTGSSVSGIAEGLLAVVESHYSLPGGVDEGVIGLWPPHTSSGRPLRLYHGGFAEYLAAPSACVHVIPESCLSRGFWPSLFEPAGNDFLLAKIATQTPGAKRFAVAGCGPHGLYAQVFLQHFGAQQIVAFELDPERRAGARELGACDAVLAPASANFQQAVQELTSSELFDVSLDMVGKAGHAFKMCCDLTRPDGTVTLFGLFSSTFEIDGTNANDIIFTRRRSVYTHQGRTLNLVGVTGREGIWPELIEAVSGSWELQEKLMKPVTVVGSLENLADLAATKPTGMLKAALYPFSS